MSLEFVGMDVLGSLSIKERLNQFVIVITEHLRSLKNWYRQTQVQPPRLCRYVSKIRHLAIEYHQPHGVQWPIIHIKASQLWTVHSVLTASPLQSNIRRKMFRWENSTLPLFPSYSTMPPSINWPGQFDIAERLLLQLLGSFIYKHFSFFVGACAKSPPPDHQLLLYNELGSHRSRIRSLWDTREYISLEKPPCSAKRLTKTLAK